MKAFMFALSLMASGSSYAADLKVGDAAPGFTAQNQAGQPFDLNARKGHWTILYFYPKAGTPGCTKQACAFRDSIKKIQKEGAEVYGISADTVAEQKTFHDEHKLGFDLLADPDDKVIALYGSKMPVVNMSKRWTFIVDPELKIASVDKDVDPLLDAQHVADKLVALKKKK
ncbi:MAG: peroxiredoxin [Chitinophagaceae bacterium]|nr:peroxiredoxin [Oligoflexus sp.]